VNVELAAPGGTRARIERIETIRIGSQPNVVWVEVTDEHGFTGLGETYYVPGAVEAVVHDLVAPLALGMDATRIAEVWQTLFACMNFHGWAGAEVRALSAIDLALWDLLGKRTGLSVATLLGGRVRDSIRVYNTCVDAGPYLDMQRWLERPADLADELLEAGFTGMKVWPWDRFAPQIASELVTGPAGWSAMGPVGHDLTPAQLAEGLACIAAIRERVGTRMDVMVEGHSRWDLNAALAICRALEAFDVAWIEDALQPTSAGDLARLARESRVPQAVSERLIGKWAYRDVLEAGAAQLVMLDVVWTGGLTEAGKIAALADTYHLPVVPHDCTGPVCLAASLQLCGHATNAKVMEVVRGFLEGWYHDVVDRPPRVTDGRAEIPDRPGLGLSLLPEVRRRDDATVRVASA
jgi:L-alanine-DL-glutamate epimerase-like enolase superfamily enzyme